LYQYSELQFEGIATGDESRVCCVVESDSMFARRREGLIPRLRPAISITKVVITAFLTARQSSTLDVLSKGQKYNQEYFVQKILPSLPNEKKRFSHRKTAMKFPVHMDNLLCHNGDRVVDE
jgi:hypothetical protein